MAVISLKLTAALDAQLTEQAHRRQLRKPELVRRACTAFLCRTYRCDDMASSTCGMMIGVRI
jgi:hypothetical protein